MSHLGKRLTALVDGELSGARRDRVLAHLARCEPCREEAVTLRLLKQRMRAMGEATADEELTGRLIALAAVQGWRPRGRWPLVGRAERAWRGGWRRRLVPSLLGAAAVVAIAVPAAAFLLGGGGSLPGPSVTPAVDVFVIQHSITGNAASAQPVNGPASAAPSAAPSGAPSAAPAGARRRPATAGPARSLPSATAATANTRASARPTAAGGPAPSAAPSAARSVRRPDPQPARLRPALP